MEVIRRIHTSDGQSHIHDECKAMESKYSEFFQPQDSVTVIRHTRLHEKAGVLYLLRQNASYWIMRNLICSSNSLIIVIYDFIQPLFSNLTHTLKYIKIYLLWYYKIIIKLTCDHGTMERWVQETPRCVHWLCRVLLLLLHYPTWNAYLYSWTIPMMPQRVSTDI